MDDRKETMLIASLRWCFYFGPILFGLMFVPPVTAQIITVLGWTAPLGLTPLAAGFVLGGCWGLYAQWRGSWLTWRL